MKKHTPRDKMHFTAPHKADLKPKQPVRPMRGDPKRRESRYRPVKPPRLEPC